MNNLQYVAPQKITLSNIQDLHTHLRWHLLDSTHISNIILQTVASYQSQFSRILVMPNILPDHLKNIDDILIYKELLEQAMPVSENYTERLLTVSLRPDTTVETLKNLKWLIKAVKYFPGWVTTNSWEVWWDLDISNPRTYEVLKYMEDEWIIFSLHPETTHAQNEYWHTIKWFAHDAEREFTKIIEEIAQTFPNLIIIAEHISTKENADLVGSWKYKNVYGSVATVCLVCAWKLEACMLAMN